MCAAHTPRAYTTMLRYTLFVYAMTAIVGTEKPALPMVGLACELYNFSFIIQLLLTDGCNDLTDCDVNAQCLFSKTEQRYQCECNYGFYGDGRNCQKLEQGYL